MKKTAKIIIIAIAAAIVVAGTVIVALCVKHYNELYPNGTYAPETILYKFANAGDMSIIRDYNNGTVKAAKFKWGILLETADDFYAVMTSEYSDKLRDDELFASVYDAL